MADGPALKFDAFTSADPHPWPAIAQDRARCPIAHVGGAFPYHQVNSYELIREANRRHEDFSNRMGVVPAGPQAEGEQVLEFADPPEHTVHRALVGKAFSVARVNEQKDRIQAIADDLVDAIAARGNSFLLRREFSRPLPSQVIAEILGVPLDDRAKFMDWTEAVEETIGGTTARDKRDDAQGNLYAYCAEQLELRRREPRDDLLSAIVHAQVDDQKLSASEATAMVGLLLGAGNGTTSIGVSNLVYLLETHPEQKAKLLADMDGLLESAVEEGFRFDCPVQGNLRGVKHDTTLGGTELKAGERIYSFYTSGNHDPDKYDRPDEFLIDRDWRRLPRHFAFGFGIHFCMGSDLARAETQIAIRTLYTRLPNLRLREGFVAEQIPGMVFRTWRELDMVFDGPALPRLSPAGESAA
ncbi:cytochrome P450 [Novosphingobium bradum]|uniref:Cytochrome P450 n=1 Tax=Novosphingobium bradum TaxID=1737444 RepID=A0ABV7IN20_9SPHN